jgi:hypothetical protein
MGNRLDGRITRLAAPQSGDDLFDEFTYPQIQALLVLLSELAEDKESASRRPLALRCEPRWLRGHAVDHPSGIDATIARSVGGVSESQPRQRELLTLRMLVTGAPVHRQARHAPRAMASSRSPSAPMRMIGGIWSGKIPGNSGKFPVQSCRARTQSRDRGLAFCERVEVPHSRCLVLRKSPSRSCPRPRSNLASNPVQTELPLSATRSLSCRVSPGRLKLADPVQKAREPPRAR